MCASPLQRDARPRLLFVQLYSVQTKKRGQDIDKESTREGGGQTQGVCSLTPAARHRPFFTLLRECMCLSIPPSNRPQMSHAGAMFPSCQLDNASEAPWMRPSWEEGGGGDALGRKSWVLWALASFMGSMKKEQ